MAKQIIREFPLAPGSNALLLPSGRAPCIEPRVLGVIFEGRQLKLLVLASAGDSHDRETTVTVVVGGALQEAAWPDSGDYVGSASFGDGPLHHVFR
jgi:hypothetical protein